jgi:hypothetical protein
VAKLPRFIMLNAAEAIPGAIPRKNEVRWRYDSTAFDAALEAADVLAQYSDKVMEPYVTDEDDEA